MKRPFLVIAAFLLALVALAPARTASAHTVNYSVFSDRTVEAAFISTAGCVETTVFVFASKSRAFVSPAPTERAASATLTITQVDSCANTALLLDGSAVLPHNALQFSWNLGLAWLRTTLTVCNVEEPDDCHHVAVNLTWRGTSNLTTRRNFTELFADDCLIVSSSFGLTRQSVAWGQVFDGATNLTPASSIPSDTRIMLARDGALTICK